MFCFILPIITITILYILIIREAVKERLKDRPRLASQAYTDDAIQPGSRFWTELNTSKYVGVLIVLWCIFQGPYLLLNFVEQYRHSDRLDPNEAVKVAYPWEIELAFTWMKLSFPIFLPLVTFCWRKEVWQKFKNLVLCRKSNLINDSSPRGNGGKKRKKLLQPNRQSSEAPGMRTPGVRDSVLSAADLQRNNSIPVLFATEDGLHFQTYSRGISKDEEEESYTEDSLADLDASRVSKIRTIKKIDVMGSQISFHREEGDTSDYDSSGEIDPFSTENPIPISVRTEYEQKNRTSSSGVIGKVPRSRQNSWQNSDGTDDSVSQSQRSNRRKDYLQKDQSLRQKNDSGIDSNHNTQEKEENRKNRKNQTKVTELIENVFEKDNPKSNSKEGKKVELIRTSSDSGQGSNEGSVNQKEKRRPKIETSPVEDFRNDDQVDPGNFNRETQVHDSKREKPTKTPVEDLAAMEDGTLSQPRKRRKRKKRFGVGENQGDNPIDSRPLPQLQATNRLSQQEVEGPADHSEPISQEDAQIMSELQVHLPPPRLKPIERKHEQVREKLSFIK